MALLPGHKYLGPGNEWDSVEFDPQDFDDVIAYYHDQAYKYSKNSAEIKRADLDAIFDFISDYYKTGNFHSAIGAAGLSIKHILERVIGHQIYPFQVNMADAGFAGFEFSSDEKNFGRYIYSLRERLGSRLFNARKSSGYTGSYKDFKKLDVWRNVLRDFKPGGTYYGLAKQGFPETYIYSRALEDYGIYGSSLSSQPGPQPGQEGQSQSESRKRPLEVPELITSKKANVETQVQTPSTNVDTTNQHASVQTVMQQVQQKRPAAESVEHLRKELNADSGNVNKNNQSSGEVRTSTGSAAANQSSSNMDIEPQTGFPLVSGAAGVGGSHSGGAVSKRSSSLSSAGFLKIPRSLPFKPMTTTFTATHIFYSYAYANTSIQNANVTSLKIQTTPLCYIPVDYIPLYLSAAEWKELPIGTKVVDLNVNISILGTRTSFDTGTTISGVATSEYVGIGVVAHGLNNKISGKNLNYDADAKNPMLPTGVKALDENAYIKKLWSDTESSTHLVPRQLSGYWICYEYQGHVTDPGADPLYNGHGHGRYRLDKLIDRYVVSTAIGQTIATYNYKPKRGYIRSPLPHYVTDGSFQYTNKNTTNFGDIYVDVQRAYGGVLTMGTRPHTILGDELGENKELIAGMSEEKTANDNHPGENPQFEYAYQMRIERVQCYRGNDGSQSTHAQPQLHVGMLAIPQLNPSTETSTYLNACMYYSVECSMTVEINFNSITENLASCQAQNAVFTDNYAGMSLGVNPYGYECKGNYPKTVNVIRPSPYATDAITKIITNTLPSGPTLL